MKHTLKMTTRDSIVVMQRPIDPTYWFPHGKLDKDFAEYYLKNEARQKGVRILRYDVYRTTTDVVIDVKVDWF